TPMLECGPVGRTGRAHRRMSRMTEPRSGRPPVPLAAALLLAMGLVAGGCSRGGSQATTTSPRATPTASVSVPTPAPPLALGKVRPGAFTSHECTPGFRCQEFVVTCSGLQEPARGVLQVQKPAGS